jgi:hypothetical protein
MKPKTKFLLTTTAFAALTLAPAGIAFATTPSRVVPGAACETIGAEGLHKGQTYRCERRDGETCGHWHWQYSPEVPKGTRTAWPVGACQKKCSPSASASPSTSASASPSVTPSASPSTSPSATPSATATATAFGSASTAATPSPSTTAVAELPVTGSTPWGLVALVVGGAAAIDFGAALLILGRRRRP